MRVTITIETKTPKGSRALADEIHALLPPREKIEEYLANIIPAVLPVKFRIVDRQTQSAFIEFDD